MTYSKVQTNGPFKLATLYTILSLINKNLHEDVLDMRVSGVITISLPRNND